MIPKVLHYCWFGRGAKSDRIEQCIDSWRRLLPDWPIVEWNETNTRLHDPYCAAAYNRGLWAMVSDHVRLTTLFEHGGVYLDTDVEVRRPLDAFLGHHCFAGFQDRPAQVDWVNNAVLGARPGHPFLSACLRVNSRVFERSGAFPRSPTVTTAVLRALGLREYGLQTVGRVTLYPAPYFYPFPWYGEFSEACVSPETHCVHHWEGFWERLLGDTVS